MGTSIKITIANFLILISDAGDEQMMIILRFWKYESEQQMQIGNGIDTTLLLSNLRH
ncbi:hypothetical protein T10_7919 [Trichinella papuae]|uniref:Uncharacterized protein n=1 Tax=Trichinella papuae TaxID=268474 RepID=A0A0V1MBS4_9BILA|nr:hypothetical protein T10_7919 [Trichinella papuae]